MCTLSHGNQPQRFAFAHCSNTSHAKSAYLRSPVIRYTNAADGPLPLAYSFNALLASLEPGGEYLSGVNSICKSTISGASSGIRSLVLSSGHFAKPSFADFRVLPYVASHGGRAIFWRIAATSLLLKNTPMPGLGSGFAP